MYVNTNPTPKNLEKGLDLAGKPLTPKSERPRASWGSLEMSLQTSEGLCSASRKCIRKLDHLGDHWPL